MPDWLPQKLSMVPPFQLEHSIHVDVASLPVAANGVLAQYTLTYEGRTDCETVASERGQTFQRFIY